jgi:hypothetical protein
MRTVLLCIILAIGASAALVIALPGVAGATRDRHLITASPARAT